MSHIFNTNLSVTSAPMLVINLSIGGKCHTTTCFRSFHTCIHQPGLQLSGQVFWICISFLVLTLVCSTSLKFCLTYYFLFIIRLTLPSLLTSFTPLSILYLCLGFNNEILSAHAPSHKYDPKALIMLID